MAVECLIPFEILGPLSGPILDIGSGGGFPGIIIALAFPGHELSLIERTGKKARFLEKATRRLDIDARIINRDFVVAAPCLEASSFGSAFMKLIRLEKKILKAAMPLIRPDGVFVWYAGISRLDFSLPDTIKASEYCYYLNDSKQLRSFIAFSHRTE